MIIVIIVDDMLMPLLSPGSSAVWRVASAELYPVPLAMADGQPSMAYC